MGSDSSPIMSGSALNLEISVNNLISLLLRRWCEATLHGGKGGILTNMGLWFPLGHIPKPKWLDRKWFNCLKRDNERLTFRNWELTTDPDKTHLSPRRVISFPIDSYTTMSPRPHNYNHTSRREHSLPSGSQCPAISFRIFWSREKD